jgi:hypothetical protein
VPNPGQPVVRDIGAAVRQPAHHTVPEGKPIELTIDVELPHRLRIARRSFLLLGPHQRRIEVELIQAVHLREVGFDEPMVRGECAPHRARTVRLREVDRISRDVGGHETMPLIGRLARRVDLHDEMLDAAVRPELDLRVPDVNLREPVGLIAGLGVALTRHALDGDRVVAEPRNEPIPFDGSTRPAGRDQQRSHQAMRDPPARDVLGSIGHECDSSDCGGSEGGIAATPGIPRSYLWRAAVPVLEKPVPQTVAGGALPRLLLRSPK